jgi:hypothetical protein
MKFLKNYYFQIVSTFLLVLSFIAFSDNLITDIGQESNSDLKFIIHGLFMFVIIGWVIIEQIWKKKKPNISEDKDHSL